MKRTIMIGLMLLPMDQGWLMAESGSCLPDLTTGLFYPIDTLQNRIQGTVESIIQLDSEAAIIEIHSSGYPRLKDSVEAILRAAKFGDTCPSGKARVQINFEISDRLEPNSKTLIKRTSESSYEVIAPGQPVVVTISDPAWSFTRRGRLAHRMREALSKLKFW